MIFANNESRKITRDLFNEFGLDLEDISYNICGWNAPELLAQSSLKTNNVAWLQNLFEALERVFSKFQRPVLLEEGVGAVLDNKKN
jgi:hypothetical protein